MKQLATAIVLFIVMLASSAPRASAQTEITGYIQSDWRHYDQSSSSGGRAFYFDARKNVFTIRRGRVKFTHKAGIADVVIQPDFTENGVSLKDAYIDLHLANEDLLDLTIGLFNRPNNEVEVSSSRRESPERSQVIRAFYPDERDLGIMASSSLPLLESLSPQLQLAILNGTRIETDPFKDITGRLTFGLPLGEESPVEVRLGGLFYQGGIPQPADSVIRYEDGREVIAFEDGNESWRGWGNRSHVGVEAQIGLDVLPFGATAIRGEYLTGTRPTLTTRVVGPDLEEPLVLLRNQTGYYAVLAQNIGDHLQLAGKIDHFDRNTDLDGREVTSTTDVAATVLGFGALVTVGDFRVTAWYEIPSYAADENPRIEGTEVIDEDLKDNLTTIRFQYRFR